METAAKQMDPSAAEIAQASVRLSRDLVDCYFLGGGRQLVKHQLDSFNDFVTRKLEQIVEIFNPVDVSNTYLPEWSCYKHVVSVSMSNPTLSKPMITEKDGSTKVMLPNDARLRNLTYAAPLTVDVNVVAKTFVPEMGAYVTDSKRLTGVSLGRIPIMVRSRYCMLSHQSPDDQRWDECQYDYGGYFIINGNEKVLVSQDRIAENRPYVFLNTKASSYSHVVEIRSVPDARCGVPKTLALKYGNRAGTYGHTIKLCMHNIRMDIPVMVMFRALGISSDKAIADMVVHPDDPDADRIVQALQGSMDECNQLRDQTEALRYLASLLTTSHHNLASPETVARNMLRKDLLPHMGISLESKAVFMGYMLSRLIRCVIGLKPLDDRDSYINKRLDTPGALVGNLFRQYYGKVVKDMRMLIQKDINTGMWRTTGMLVNVLNKGNVYKMIKATVIETGLKYGLATGNWGMKTSRMRQGVAQVLNRMTYGATLSHLRRVNTPIEKTGKLVQPRKLHPTQWGIMCPSETPEGASVGLVKNMALLTTVTSAMPSEFVREAIARFGSMLLLPMPLDASESDITAYGEATMVMVNGDILGVHPRPDLLVAHLRGLKRSGALDVFTSITWNVPEKIVTICTDGGRFTRPMLVVDQESGSGGRLVLERLWPEAFLGTEDLPDWHKMVLAGAIEYMDVEETNTALIAMTLTELSTTHERYKRYTHMEVAPFAMLGIMAGSIPFSHHNQAPRNTYQSAMGKQAIGVYAQNFRHRFDTITHVLSYPQRPMVSTHTARIVQCDTLPSGTNAIVAFACFTGFNQEDSVIMNQSAVERGLLVTTLFRTLREQNAKNHSTGEEEFFCRPDHMSMRVKPYNYDKLAENGFVPEGGRVGAGDVLIGKCMPQKAGHGIQHKDTSVVIKSANESGIVDRNCHGNRYYTNVTGDGYTFAKVRVRQERRPTIGDKVSCYTADHEVLTETHGWVPIAEIDSTASGHRVATLTYDGKLTYSAPVATQSYDYDGPLVELHSEGISLLVTPEHRMWVQRNGCNNDYTIVLAGETVGKNTRHTKIVKSCRDTSGYLDVDLHGLGMLASHSAHLETTKLPSWCLTLPSIRARSLLFGFFHRGLQCQVTSKTLGGQLQQIALHAGFACDVEPLMHRDGLQMCVLACSTMESRPITESQEVQPQKQKQKTTKVYCCSVSPNVGPGLLYVRRHGRAVWCGNSRHGQKGTIGMLYREEDMPFTSSGIVPSIIVNPHAIPSRMTIGQLMEALESKAGAFSGSMRDATAFGGRTLEDIMEELASLGIEQTGNEVMYNPRTGEQMPCAVFVCPTYYQRLKHMTTDKVHCVTGDHDVLTASGWKPIAQVSMDDDVATLRDGALAYERPLEVLHYPDYEGRLYSVRGRFVNLVTTPEHRMYVSIQAEADDGATWKPHALVQARDIVGRVKYQRDAQWDAPDYQFLLPATESKFSYPARELPMDAWLDFFGIWMAEGWAAKLRESRSGGSYRVEIAQNKPRVKAALHPALDVLGYNYSVSGDDKLTIHDKQLYEYLRPLSVTAPHKRLPEWVWLLSSRQARRLMDAMILGDGTWRGKSISYYTSSVGLADDFMRLALHAGLSATKYAHLPADKTTTMKDGRVITANHVVWRLSVIMETHNKPGIDAALHTSVTDAPVREPVYCLRVPSEVFYVRHNGVPCWTGNSRGANGPVVLLTRQPAEGRARDGGLRLGEMELECLWAHGTISFLKERFMECSDNYRVFVCAKCSMMAVVSPENGTYSCRYCNNLTDFREVRIPYASKLFLQEVETMAIGARLLTN